MTLNTPKANWRTLYGLVAAGLGLLFGADVLIPTGGARTLAEVLIVLALTVAMLGWVRANRLGLLFEDRSRRTEEPLMMVHGSLRSAEANRFITRPAA